MRGERLGCYVGVWIHELSHGLPGLIFVGPWGFGERGSGLPIAIPGFGAFVLNPAGWAHFLESRDTLTMFAVLLATVLAPYPLHVLAHLLDKGAVGRSFRQKEGHLARGLWDFLAHPGSGIVFDMAIACFLTVILLWALVCH